jgi:hypothetical protein
MLIINVYGTDSFYILIQDVRCVVVYVSCVLKRMAPIRL